MPATPKVAALRALDAHPGVTVEVMTITPEMAAEMLKHNLVNRTLRRKRVELYAKQMRNNTWRLTGETIVFSPDGQLLQGQHRLTAAAENGLSFDCVVVRGIVPEAMRVMDTGLSRTAADAFKLEGVSNSPTQAAMCRQLISVRGGFPMDTARQALITRDVLFAFYEANVSALEFAWHISRAAQGALHFSRAGWGTLAFLAAEADPDLAAEFFNGLGTGAGLSAGDARLALRSLIANFQAQRRTFTWAEQVATGIRAWNAWVNGRKVDHIKSWKSVHQWPELEA